jgi:ParB/RepB/Spo0J family partition protein
MNAFLYHRQNRRSAMIKLTRMSGPIRTWAKQFAEEVAGHEDAEDGPPAELENIRHVRAIIVGERIRQDYGDIDGLAASFLEVGQLQEVVIRPDGHLVLGARRRRAAIRAGWSFVRVRVVHNLDDALAMLKAERDENTCRKDYLPSEAAAMVEALMELEQAEAEKRKQDGRKRGAATTNRLMGRTVNESVAGNFPGTDFGRVRDKLAKSVGMSGRTLEKIQAVVAVAKKEPETYGDLKEEMDRTGKVDPAFKEVQQIQVRQARAEQLSAYVDVTADGRWEFRKGDFRVELAHVPDNSLPLMLTDPPYDYDSVYKQRSYAALREFAARKLTDDGLLLAYIGSMYLPEILKQLLENDQLDWFYDMALLHKGLQAERVPALHVMQCHKRIFMLTKKDCKRRPIWLPDVIWGSGKEKDMEDWQQGQPESEWLIGKLTEKGETVCDPYAGSATVGAAALVMGRKFIGAEILPDRYEKAKLRLAEASLVKEPNMQSHTNMCQSFLEILGLPKMVGYLKELMKKTDTGSLTECLERLISHAMLIRGMPLADDTASEE